MTKIFSKLDPSKLLHMIVRKEDIKEGRTDLCPTEQFLQCAALKLPKGTTFKAHKHNWNEVNDTRLAQESWAVISGLVVAFLFDTNGVLLERVLLNPGDASFTFSGYHTYEILTEDSYVLEYKTGPYVSQQHDKTFLED